MVPKLATWRKLRPGAPISKAPTQAGTELLVVSSGAAERDGGVFHARTPTAMARRARALIRATTNDLLRPIDASFRHVPIVARDRANLIPPRPCQRGRPVQLFAAPVVALVITWSDSERTPVRALRRLNSCLAYVRTVAFALRPQPRIFQVYHSLDVLYVGRL